MKRYLEPFELTEQPQAGCQTRDRVQQESFSPIWVELAVLPNPFSHNQALLICQVSEDEWLGWIPDHGEAILHVSEFYGAADWN